MGEHDLSKLRERQFDEVEQAYDARDSILYALGAGFGVDPLDEEQLRFVYEPALKAAPTMATVLAHPGVWYANIGIDYVKVVHASERIEIFHPLPAKGVLVARNRVVDFIDRGHRKGGFLVSERDIRDKATGVVLATVTQTAFCRADGGRGGTSTVSPVPHKLPDRAPDAVCSLPTSPQAALIYRLSGDPNPLHVDPATAQLAGFPRPILHGLATYGVVGHAMLRTLCGYDTNRLRGMDCRFTAPVYPGDTIRTEMWQDGETVSFRALVGEKAVVDNGWARVIAG